MEQVTVYGRPQSVRASVESGGLGAWCLLVLRQKHVCCNDPFKGLHHTTKKPHTRQVCSAATAAAARTPQITCLREHNDTQRLSGRASRPKANTAASCQQANGRMNAAKRDPQIKNILEFILQPGTDIAVSIRTQDAHAKLTRNPQISLQIVAASLM